MHKNNIFWLIVLSSLQLMTSFSMEDSRESIADQQYRQVQQAIKKWNIDKADRIMQSTNNALTDGQRASLKDFALNRNTIVQKFNADVYAGMANVRVFRGMIVFGAGLLLPINANQENSLRSFLGYGIAIFGLWDMYTGIYKSMYANNITDSRKSISQQFASYQFQKK